MTSKRKRQTHRAKGDLEELQRQMRTSEDFKGQGLIFLENEEEKMSAVMWDFIAPYRDGATTPKACELLIMLAVIAWNAALLLGENRQSFLDKSVNSVGASLRDAQQAELVDLLDELIRRKEQYFAENKRYIANYRLTTTEKEYYLSVVSTL